MPRKNTVPDVYTDVVDNIHGKNSAGLRQYADDESSSTVCMSRTDMAKARHLAKTKNGDAIGINLARGTVLRNGDVLQGPEGRCIIIEQTAEKVVTLRFSGAAASDEGSIRPDTLLLAGHIIGNRHKPISVSEGGRTVIFPIQDDAEIQTFRVLFERRMPGQIQMHVSEEVFMPDEGANVQGHG